uniref:Integrase zinc-binding domain-containing protein n=1 Tax=Gasterosteus aculeatus TaxID=69293 RepID=G3N7C3_GASAC
LDAFLDAEDVLKVEGRLSRSSFPNSFKHPTVIPPGHHVTNLIIAHYHETVKHQGKGFTINEIRSDGYWICGLSRAVATHIRHCVTCRRVRRPVESQRMSDLPVERAEPTRPFTYCGMECFGPFWTKQGRKQEKRYGLLLTCFCSRAIHIEMLEDLSTDTFINGLICFIALRGAELDMNRLNVFLTEKQCDFVMNAPHASHAGGVWERQIRTVRSVLNATLLLSPDHCATMAIVNSRPLTADALDGHNRLEPLTPNHLITMKSTPALPPPGKFEREDLYGRKRWRQVQYLTEQFGSRWKREYLHSITTRQCWHSTKRNLQVGDIVM